MRDGGDCFDNTSTQLNWYYTAFIFGNIFDGFYRHSLWWNSSCGTKSRSSTRQWGLTSPGLGFPSHRRSDSQRSLDYLGDKIWLIGCIHHTCSCRTDDLCVLLKYNEGNWTGQYFVYGTKIQTASSIRLPFHAIGFQTGRLKKANDFLFGVLANNAKLQGLSRLLLQLQHGLGRYTRNNCIDRSPYFHYHICCVLGRGRNQKDRGSGYNFLSLQYPFEHPFGPASSQAQYLSLCKYPGYIVRGTMLSLLLFTCLCNSS